MTIDARALDGTLMGTQVYVLELVRALARTGALELRVLIRIRRIDPGTLALLRGLPGVQALAEEEVDEDTPPTAVFHRPQQAFCTEDVALACDLGERIVVSQLDLIAYSDASYFPDAAAVEDYRRAARHGMAAAERVVVLSEHTRNELLKQALVEDERIRIVAPGVDHGRGAQPRRPEALARDGTERTSFLLCIGADYAHKNRVFAIRLLGELRARYGWRGTLVLAGTHVEHGSSRVGERELLERDPELRAVVIELGPVGEEEKEWLMREACAVVYPSMYEGFGLVPFEAAERSVPCLFAPVSALAEHPAAGATLVPWDAERSAAAAYPLLADAAARAEHIQMLADAARELTWERAAAAMVAIYREAASAPVREAATLSRDAVTRERQLAAAHQQDVDTLIGERELVLGDYEALIAEVGAGRSLVGPRGSLPEDLQRALLALGAHPSLRRPLYGLAAGAFRLARALARAARWPLRRR